MAAMAATEAEAEAMAAACKVVQHLSAMLQTQYTSVYPEPGPALHAPHCCRLARNLPSAAEPGTPGWQSTDSDSFRPGGCSKYAVPGVARVQSFARCMC
jgi:hypothetical protein